jgi:hypothetical protein
MDKLRTRPKIMDYLSEIMARPFEWSVHDCAVGLAFPIIEIQTGIDLGSPFRGTYDSMTAAIKVYRRAGYEDLAGLLASRFKEISPSFAQFGDVAVLDEPPENWALGVVVGDRVGVVMDDCYGTVERGRMKRAFRIVKEKQT